jgi:hypothetical protein
MLACHQPVTPFSIRLDVTKEPCGTLALPFHQTTELAAQRIRELKAPAGVKVLVL